MINLHQRLPVHLRGGALSGVWVISLAACIEFVWDGYKWLEKSEVMAGPIPIGPAERFALSVGGGIVALATGWKTFRIQCKRRSFRNDCLCCYQST